MRKKVDARIRTVVENAVKSRTRSLFVIVGDKGRDQVVNLHYLLSKMEVKSRPTVLWCYKKDLFLSSHRKKRMNQIRKMVQRGLLDPEKEDPFSLFMASTQIRYCYYKDTHKILGNTYGMCVLQDFEALTPNLLARTIETVEGGGSVILLLSKMDSLQSLYTMTMDVHARFRTESHQDVVGRFNERFILSLASNPAMVVMDDELNILPVSSHIRNITPFSQERSETSEQRELENLKHSLKETQPVGNLVSKCRTFDQAKAVVSFLDAASEKTLRATVALTASRGRGKSAAMGISIAGAIAMGYSNIFVTAPSPENLNTLFAFVLKGFDALDYVEHQDYDIVQSANPDFNKAIVRINVYKDHRQTIQYIQPMDHQKLSQAELVVIDEAAAIPLPMVKRLLGNYLVYMGSTVNGYEGTGRSLSLKLLEQLRQQSQQGSTSRSFREIELSEPIRYAAGDQVEKWLHELLCLDASLPHNLPPLSRILASTDGSLPHPSKCELFYVERDTLFSYHKAAEKFLHRIMALMVASHYKNTPNDLQLMSDAPGHQVFVLLPPFKGNVMDDIPNVLAVVQVALEGAIAKESASAALAQGMQPSGDMIPWTVSQQFQDSAFPTLSGARIIRISVHPELQRGGYGQRTVDLLHRYFEGQLAGLDDVDEDEGEDEDDDSGPDAKDMPNGKSSNSISAAKRPKESGGEEGGLLNETVEPRSKLPPLLVRLSERKPEHLHYLGVSYGITQSLYSFWSKLKFYPVYIRQTASDITGEHTCIMLRRLSASAKDLDEKLVGQGDDESGWIFPLVQDFRRRMVELLGSSFREMDPGLAMSALSPRLSFSNDEAIAASDPSKIKSVTGGTVTAEGFTSYDLARLESYSRNLVDYHLIMDLVPALSKLYYMNCLPVTLSHIQAAILLMLGLQFRSIKDVDNVLDIPGAQVLALFNKSIRKIHTLLNVRAKTRVDSALPRVNEIQRTVPEGDVDIADKEVEQEANEIQKAISKEAETMLSPEKLEEFKITVDDKDFESALESGKIPSSGFLSVKSSSSKRKHIQSEKKKTSKSPGKPKNKKPKR